jgi:acid phosphatase (class A)
MTGSIKPSWQSQSRAANEVAGRGRRTMFLGLSLVAAVVFSSSLIVHKSALFIPNLTADYAWQHLLPPPPSPGSAMDQADMAAIQRFQSQADSPRWQQAQRDISFDIFPVYQAVLGTDFTAKNYPEVAALIDYAGVHLNRASAASKAAFMRPRPYVSDPSLRLCTTEAPQNTSYPSGHAGWGWLSARIIAQIETEHADAILARGRDYGDSRVVCGVHYPSDVEAGRALGEAVFKALERDRQYQRLLSVALGSPLP